MTYRYNNNIYYCTECGNKVLNLSSENQETVYNWDFGKYNNTDEDFEKLFNYYEEMNNKQQFRQAGENVWNGFILKSILLNPFETSRFRVATVRLNKVFYSVFIDKYKKTTKVFASTKENINLLGDCAENEKYILYRNIFSKGNSNICSSKMLSPENMQVLRNHNPEIDNPYLVICTFKK